MPMDYSKYPPNWKTEIVPRILARANNCCEWDGCRLPNGSYINKHTRQLCLPDEDNVTKVVLTVAHLDHDPENWDVQDDRLQALCQMHHLQYDMPRHVAKRKYGGDYFKHPKLDI